MDVARIKPEHVLDAMRRGERVQFVDSRSDQAHANATEQIPGSIRIPPNDIDRWASHIPADAMVVTYCT